MAILTTMATETGDGRWVPIPKLPDAETCFVEERSYLMENNKVGVSQSVEAPKNEFRETDKQKHDRDAAHDWLKENFPSVFNAHYLCGCDHVDVEQLCALLGDYAAWKKLVSIGPVEAPLNKWISVEERLPEKVELYLGFVPPNIMGVCFFADEMWWNWPDNENDREAFGLTHWQPLPAPPEAEPLPAPTKYDLTAIASEIQLEIQDGSSISQEFRDIVKVLERHFGTEAQETKK